jgi:xanthine/uracil permease
LKHLELSEEQLSAESDRSPGVLLASGYIAGGAIAGIVIAFMAGVWSKADSALTHWAETSNPFYAGANADLLALIPFVALAVFLYAVGRSRQGGEGTL